MSDPLRDVPTGTIIDADIEKLAREGLLISENFDQRFVKQACYELRTSEVFYDTARDAENKRIEVGPAGFYLLRPNCYVVAISLETLRLPADVLGRILTKGRLFSIGILPVNTYADPGFKGRVGITLYNASQRYIAVRPGEPIAKIEFDRLRKPVANPYSGQHGYETEIWPVATHIYANMNDERTKSQLGNDTSELEVSYGPRIAQLAEDVRFYTQKVWAQLAVVGCCFALLFWLHGQLSLAVSIAIGVMSNLLTNLIVRLSRPKTRSKS